MAADINVPTILIPGWTVFVFFGIAGVCRADAQSVRSRELPRGVYQIVVFHRSKAPMEGFCFVENTVRSVRLFAVVVPEYGKQ